MRRAFFLIILAVSLYGVGAYQGEIEFKQSDNSTFKAQLKGDEWFSWVETKEGYVAKYNAKTKNYEYMILNASEELSFSNVKVIQSVTYTSGASKASVYLPNAIKKIPLEALGKIWKKAWEEEQAMSLKK